MDYRPIERDDILMGRDLQFPLDKTLEKNLETLLERINKLAFKYYNDEKKNLTVSSGFRPAYFNTRVGGAKSSAHKTCMAVDFNDERGDVKKWILKNVSLLQEFDLYLEQPERTSVWCHIDIRKRSNRIFLV